MQNYVVYDIQVQINHPCVEVSGQWLNQGQQTSNKIEIARRFLETRAKASQFEKVRIKVVNFNKE